MPLSQLSLLIGGLTLLAFLARVGFMPDLSMASALSLIYAVALLGLATLFAFLVMLVLPSLLMRHGLPWPQGARPSGTLLLSSTVLASLAWVAYFAAWAVGPASWHGGLGQAVTWLAFAALLFWASLSFAPAARVARVPGLLAAMAFALQFAALSMPLVVLAPLAGGDQLAHASTWTGAAILVGLILLLAVTTTLRVFLWDRSLLAALALTVAEFMLVVSATGSAGYLLDNVMARLQLGHVQPVRVVLTRSGCLQLNLAAGVPVCAVPTAADVPAVVCPLSIRSRIGAQVLLAPVAEAALQPDWQVVLERKELLAWSRVAQACDAKTH